MRLVRKSALGGALAGLVVAGLAAASTGAQAPQPIATSAACTPAVNVEAIIDDSGSMSITDPNRLRVRGLDLLMRNLSPTVFLGAVEFGSVATTVFPPRTIGPNRAANLAALFKVVKADDGSTDYNAAFAKATADNPFAPARIFLTDGGHNAGTYNNGHLSPNVPTYVVGFADALTSATDRARLKQIASDTHGKFYPLKTSNQVQAVMNDISSRLSCQPPPTSFVNVLKQGSSESYQVLVVKGTKTVRITVSWPSPKDQFTISNVRLVGTSHKLGISKSSGNTFIELKVSNLVKGKLAFSIKAKKVARTSLGGGKVTVVSQVGKIK
jgi:hypothetical protein